MQLSKRGCVFSDLPRRPKGSGSSSCFTAAQQKIGNPIRCTHSNIRPYLRPCISVCIVHREAKTKSTSKPVLLSALLFNWNQVWMTNVKCKLEVISNGSLAFTGGYCKQFRKLSISLASSAITDREKGFCLFETLLMTPCAQIDLSLKVRTTPKTQVLESRHCAARDLLFLFFFDFLASSSRLLPRSCHLLEIRPFIW